jgi:hypothetical protein
MMMMFLQAKMAGVYLGFVHEMKCDVMKEAHG